MSEDVDVRADEMKRIVRDAVDEAVGPAVEKAFAPLREQVLAMGKQVADDSAEVRRLVVEIRAASPSDGALPDNVTGAPPGKREEVLRPSAAQEIAENAPV